MMRTTLSYGLEEELLETGRLLDHFLSLKGRTTSEQQALNGIIYKLMSRHMRLMNERSNLYALQQEVNQRHPGQSFFILTLTGEESGPASLCRANFREPAKKEVANTCSTW